MKFDIFKTHKELKQFFFSILNGTSYFHSFDKISDNLCVLTRRKKNNQMFSLHAHNTFLNFSIHLMFSVINHFECPRIAHELGNIYKINVA